MDNVTVTKGILFVASSQDLTFPQIKGLEAQFGEMEIVTLGEVSPELQKSMNIPEKATLIEIQELAKLIVVEALKVGATHFYLTGEPTLTMWANLYASQEVFGSNRLSKTIEPEGVLMKAFEKRGIYLFPMICIQSTEFLSVETTSPDGSATKTQILSHVKWRELF